MEGFWNSIVEISAPISALGTLLITWCVYRLNTRNSKKENYFRQMVELYYKIEEDYSILYGLKFSNEDIEQKQDWQREQSIRRIGVNSTLMTYYLLRIPGYYKNRDKFLSFLYGITHDPQAPDNYDNLSKKFIEFCWELSEKKKKTHTFHFEYDGKPMIE